MENIKIILLLTLTLLFSCKEVNEKQKVNIKKNNTVKITENDIHLCTTVKDTIFKNGDFIKYIPLKNGFYGVELKYEGILDSLNFKFDCNTPNGMIPKFLFKNKSIALSQGSSINYRNLILCSFNKSLKQIEINEFETEVIEPSENDFFLYTKDNFVYLFNRKNENTLCKKLPNNSVKFKIKKFKIFKNKITIIFEQGDELNYNLKDFLETQLVS